jgi:methionyl-tRNA formyltransferase
MLKMAFIGSKPLGLSMLKALVEASPDGPWRVIHPTDTDDDRSCLRDFHNFAGEKALEFVLAKTPEDANESLKSFKPDVVFVCGWYWLLKQEVLDLASFGFWGLHNSLLPKYRGSSPLVWSIINGDEFVGGTIFKFTHGMDDGEILYQAKVSLGDDANIADILDTIETDILANFPSRWRALIEGRAETRGQDHSQATYCGQRIEEDGLIDWTQSAQRVHNFIRAQSRPYPGAFTYFKAEKIVIQRSSIDKRIFYGTPGQILQRSPVVTICCGGDTAISVHEVEINGRLIDPSKVFSSIKNRLVNRALGE